jgi:hypothetical protein
MSRLQAGRGQRERCGRIDRGALGVAAGGSEITKAGVIDVLTLGGRGRQNGGGEEQACAQAGE